jgi:teichuronic acid biosynthesis glycosyltransferase TuaC
MIKIAFVYRGYGPNNTNSLIDFQCASLNQTGIEIKTFPFKGGVKNYLRSIFELRKFVKKEGIDILHAHYSFSGFIAGLSFSKPVFCSLMGSDVLRAPKILRFITWLFYKMVWKVTVVKSQEMHKLFPKSHLIANGVDFTNFRPIPREEALKKTGFSASGLNIIFVAEDPSSSVKNLALVKEALQSLNNKDIKLQLVSGKSYTDLPYYYNAADLLVLTSLSEGSPNVIKEAMACNCPIVATDVGDIRQVMGNTAGCFITNFDAADVAAKIRLALDFKSRTNGRNDIQHLDSRIVAEKIIGIYKNILSVK